MTVIVRNGYTYQQYLHVCGEVVRAAVRDGSILFYADISLHKVVVCPHCLRDIEWEDLSEPSMEQMLGWPSLIHRES